VKARQEENDYSIETGLSMIKILGKRIPSYEMMGGWIINKCKDYQKKWHKSNLPEV